MIPEPLRQKLTALVDGELPPAERDALLHTLRESPEAREWYERIKQDSERLKALPVRHLPSGFAKRVVGEIRSRRLQPRRPRLVLRRSTMWAAAAAAGIIAVTHGTLALIMNMQTPNGRPYLTPSTGPEQGPKPNSITKNDPQIDQVPRHIAKVESRGLENWKLAVERWNQMVPSREAVADYVAQWRDVLQPIGDPLRSVIGSSSAELARLVEGMPERLSGEGLDFSQPGVLTFPPTVRMPFKSVDVKLPLFLDLGKFESAELGDLVNRLQRNQVYHIDLSCKQSWLAFERFQAACKAAGVKLVVDPEVTTRMGKRYPAFYMAYLENVTPEQVAKVLSALKAADKTGDHQFDSVMVQALEVEGRRKLAESLGLAPKAMEKLPAGQGGAPAVKPTEPTAVALICFPNRNRLPLSKEVKQLLDNRGWQPDAVHVVFLLRPDRG